MLFSSLCAGLLVVASSHAGAQLASAGLDEFLADYGQDLNVRYNFDTGYPAEVFGRAMDLGFQPVSDADFESAARAVVDNYNGMFGFSSDSLSTMRVKRIDMSRIGSSNKVAVVFQQEVDNLKVAGGYVTMMFLESGALIGISNDGLPGVDDMDLIPTITSDQAGQIASRSFGREVLVQKDVDILVVANRDETGPALAWNINLQAVEWENNLPVAERITVDAHTGEVIRKQSTIHSIDLVGRARGWGSPGTAPDKASNPATKHKLIDMSIQSTVGNTTTDIDGKWTIPYGGNQNQTVTADFGITAPYARVINTTGKDIDKIKTVVPGQVLRLRFNQKGSPKKVAQINAHKELIVYLDFIEAIDPSDNTMFFQQRMNTNIGSTCNAFFDGSSTNYYLAGGGCVNTSYSTVVAHETGHWANVRYGQGNGPDGFGEGNADNWATYVYDNPIVGEDFCGTGCHVRDGRNTRQYCGSCGAGCHGGVHANGEVLMGACWKARDRLNNSLGDAAGDLVADTIFVAWVNAYPGDDEICHNIRNHWLLLDDDDGNLGNGTPNGTDIDEGFKDQGFPGFF